MVRDLRHAVRILLKAKAWTAVVLLLLALGIGANLALFGAVNGVLLRKIPVQDPDTLVRLGYAGKNDMVTNSSGYGPTRLDAGDNVRMTFSIPMFEAFRAGNHTMTGVVACAPTGRVNLVVDGNADIATSLLVSGNYFSMLGVSVASGRTLVPDDDRPGAPPVAVLSASYWRTRFGSDPQAIGKTVRANNVPITIVGILPASYTGVQLASGEDRDITVPLALDQRLTPPVGNALPRASQPTSWWVEVVGRVKPGVTAAAVQADLEGVFRSTSRGGLDQYLAGLTAEERRITTNRNRTAIPRLLVDSASHGVYSVNPADERSITILSSVVVLVLLVVCANVANLLLSRAVSRRKEISIRLSLGATRARVVRQLLTESLLLSTAGGALGVLVGRWGQAFRPGSLGRVGGADWRALAFVIAATTLTGLAFGLAPAFKATSLDVNTALKESSRSVVESRSLLGKVLLVAQVAVSLALLVGAGLFLRTLDNLRRVDVGFNPGNIALFRVSPRLNGYDDARIVAFYHELLERIAATPGVRAAALSQQALLSGSESTTDMFVQGEEYTPGKPHNIYTLTVSPVFFDTMEMPLVAGRGFTDRDSQGAGKVAVVNETAVRQYFGGANPIGRRFGQSVETAASTEVVGVVRDAKYDDLRDGAPPTMYVNYAQNARAVGAATLEVRTAGDPLAGVPLVRDVVRRMDPTLPVIGVSTQTAAIEERFSQEKVLAQAYVLFGLLALLVASVGLFGLMSYSVARRTNEIGIRMALGAQPAVVLRHVMGESMRLVGAGIVAGVVLTFLTGRLISSLLFGLAPTDAATIAAACGMLAAVSALASFLPARRASRVDPLVALRSE
jgi:predicted permease